MEETRKWAYSIKRKVLKLKLFLPPISIQISCLIIDTRYEELMRLSVMKSHKSLVANVSSS